MKINYRKGKQNTIDFLGSEIFFATGKEFKLQQFLASTWDIGNFE